MKKHTQHALTTSIVLGVLAIGAVAFAYSGIYNIGADDQHTTPVYNMLTTLRERSITARANKLHPPPNLKDAAMIRQGAGNYSAMCTGCHLAPGMEETELSKGLYPTPPSFEELARQDPAHNFWVIKHGIKASGMPAWGKSMQDEFIWGMAAFLQELPKLDAAQYQALVDSSGGHSHGGGETKPHDDSGAAPGHHDPAKGAPADESKPHPHPPGTPAHQDKTADPHAGMHMGGKKAADESKPHAHPPGTPAHQDKPAAKPAAATVEHRHADGTVESHPAPKPQPADDGHDHQH